MVTESLEGEQIVSGESWEGGGVEGMRSCLWVFLFVYFCGFVSRRIAKVRGFL